MRILIYILEYLAVGLVTAWIWNKMRIKCGKEQCLTYSVLDTLLWPIICVRFIVGFIEELADAITTIMRGS